MNYTCFMILLVEGEAEGGGGNDLKWHKMEYILTDKWNTLLRIKWKDL